MKNTSHVEAALIAILLIVTACSGKGREIDIGPEMLGKLSMAAAERCKVSENNKRTYDTTPPATFSAIDKELIEKIQKKYINGCASIEFQIDKNGNPLNVHLLSEFPAGQDIGKAAVKEIKASRYQPPEHAGKWYFTNRAYASAKGFVPYW